MEELEEEERAEQVEEEVEGREKSRWRRKIGRNWRRKTREKLEGEEEGGIGRGRTGNKWRRGQKHFPEYSQNRNTDHISNQISFSAFPVVQI